MSATDRDESRATGCVSFRPDLFQADPPTLIGSACTACACTAFPPREVCPQCGELATTQPVQLSRRGVIYSFTVVHQAPPGVATPYMLGYVDLPDDRVRVLTRIEAEPAEVAIGVPVDLVAHQNERDPTGESVIFAFAVSRDKEGNQ